MPSLAKLRFRKSIPLPLEIALVQRHGFHVSVKRGAALDYVTFEKDLVPINKRPLKTDSLDEATKNECVRKCTRIMDMFDNPEGHIRSIRARISNLASCHPPLERQFMHEWMMTNVVEEDT